MKVCTLHFLNGSNFADYNFFYVLSEVNCFLNLKSRAEQFVNKFERLTIYINIVF